MDKIQPIGMEHMEFEKIDGLLSLVLFVTIWSFLTA